MTTKYVGDGFPVQITVRDEAGALANPSTIALTHVNPAGTPTAVALTNTGTGTYTGTYTFVLADGDASGTGALNHFECVTTGPDIGGPPLQVRVKFRPSQS